MLKEFDYRVTFIGNNTQCTNEELGVPFGGVVEAETEEDAVGVVKAMVNNFAINPFAANASTNETTDSPFNMYLKNGIKSFGITHSLTIESIYVAPSKVIYDGYWSGTELGDKFNHLWSIIDARRTLSIIMRAYYERDLEEMANHFDGDNFWWKLYDNGVTYDEFISSSGLHEFVSTWASYIADEGDLNAVIDFCRGWEL